MNLRKAKSSDLPFITECIIESEKSGSNTFPYQELLGLNETAFSNFLESVFEEEIEDQPWFMEYWYVVEIDKMPVAGCCAWIETTEGISSDLLKTQIFSALLGDTFKNNIYKLAEVSKISISRKPGTLQFEHLYTHPNHRGKGYMKMLLEYIANQISSSQHEIQLLQNNLDAFHFYKKIGFKTVDTQCNPEILRLNLLGDSCKIKMERFSTELP